MIIDRKKISNPYLLAFVDVHKIKDGENIKTYEYMFWIDGMHTEYRNLHNIPEHIIFNETQVKDFTRFLREDR